MEIRIPNKEETFLIAEIHLAAFKGFFLSELGHDFLFTYYNAIRENDKGILIGCFENSKLLGFCAATTLSNGFNTYLVKQNYFHFLSIGLKLLFSKPNAIIRLLKNFTKKADSIADDGQYAELLSIGVLPEAQGKGVGKILLSTLENSLREKQIKSLSLTTDFFENYKTLNFYQSIDFEIKYEFVAYPNRKMYRLIKTL